MITILFITALIETGLYVYGCNSGHFSSNTRGIKADVSTIRARCASKSTFDGFAY